MAATPRKRPTTTTRKAADQGKRAAGREQGPKAKKSAPAPRQPRRRSAPPEPPVAPPVPVVDEVVAPIAATLTETTAQAVERALAVVHSTPRRAVQIATVRALADALDRAEPGDRPKISRELDTRMSVLLADAIPVGEPPDWTEQAGGTPT